MARIVGSDIAHAVPLTLIAGTGHWMMGSVDWHIIGSLLAGSLPGIFVGSYFAIRVPERALRLVRLRQPCLSWRAASSTTNRTRRLRSLPPSQASRSLR